MLPTRIILPTFRLNLMVKRADQKKQDSERFVKMMVDLLLRSIVRMRYCRECIYGIPRKSEVCSDAVRD